MKTTHTKGNWYIEPERENNEFDVEGIDISCGTTTALATVWNPDNHKDENESNAKLIAAAPEMLEALIEANYILSRYVKTYKHTMKKANDLVENAIKKATS